MKNIAIVTGASSGLGRAYVGHLDQGALGELDEIWAVARRGERLEALARTCKTTVVPLTLDLTKKSSIRALAQRLDAEGNVNVRVLVNCAGFGTFGDFALYEPGKTSQMVELLMRAPVELIYESLPYMHAGSRIVNIASVAAFIPQPRLALYSACKRFVLDLSRSLDAELGEVGIHVTAVCPKFMRTEFLDHAQDDESARKMCVIGFEDQQRVVRKSLESARRGKSLCIPSADMKALYAVSRVCPYKAALAIERLIGAL